MDYASYVILERAIPHIHDGLKPVQRRILHTLWEMDDGRFNKVANVVGSCMKYHPHGDASIADALVQLGQKELLVDTQGNWGDILTGDPAAAPRYIEARLSKLSQLAAFNEKLTAWLPSYDGRNKEPVTLPVKFPLLLAQGAEGIAVGLSCKMLPHNLSELIDASIAVLRGKKTELIPDFPTGGSADFTDYLQGQRGGKVRVRATIETRSKYLLAITEIPFGTTTHSLIESIIAANAKEKIKVRKIEDNTASTVEILLHLPQGADPEKTIDALYVFTDCEISISPNACVIAERKPEFTNTLSLLERSTARTKELLKRELELLLEELADKWHAASLEKIFIEHKLYRVIEGAESEDKAVEALEKALAPHAKSLKRPIVRTDILRLIELRFRRLAKYDVQRAQNDILKLEAEMVTVRYNLEHLTDYSVKYFQELKSKFGANCPRKTKILTFGTIVAAQVAVANEKLYVNKAEGFVGYGLRDQELVASCSTLDDVVVFLKDGTMKVNRVSEKAFFGKDILHAGILKKNDLATTYHMIYSDGPEGSSYVKRFNVTGITRDKVYHLTQETPGSVVKYFSVNPKGWTETIQAILFPGQGARKTELDFSFAELAVKGRNSQGNVFTKYKIKSVKKTGETKA